MKKKENEDNENENKNEDNEKENKNEEEEKLRKEYENEKNKKNKIIKKNEDLDKIIDKSKSFEDQMKLIRKVKNLNEYYTMHDYANKELKLKIFKIKLANMSNIIDEKLFEKICAHKLIKVATKVINIKNKEEYQIIVKNI